MTWIQTRKYFGEPSNIYESLSPFYYTLKFFGLASYNLNFKNGKMKTSWIHYIMMFGFIPLYLCFYYNFLNIDDSTYSPGEKSILIYGFFFFYHFQYITIVLIMIFNFLKRGNVEKFLKYLKTFDDHSEKMEWKFKVNHEQNYWRFIFWIVISLIILIVVYVMQIFWVPSVPPEFSEYIDNIFYCIVTNAFVLISLQFIFGVQSVASRFEILNQNTR